MAPARWETEALMLPGEVPSLADLIPARPRWMGLAACRGMAAATFFPSRGEPMAKPREVCAACPTSEPCLSYAVRRASRVCGLGRASGSGVRCGDGCDKGRTRGHGPRPPRLRRKPSTGWKTVAHGSG